MQSNINHSDHEVIVDWMSDIVSHEPKFVPLHYQLEKFSGEYSTRQFLEEGILR